MGPDRMSPSEMLRSTDDSTGDDITEGWATLADGAGGVEWGPVAAAGGGGGGGGGALVFLEEHAASASSSLDFTTFISALYDTYLIVGHGIQLATDNVDLRVQVGTGAGPTYDTGDNYEWSAIGRTVGGATVTDEGATGAGIRLFNGATNDAGFGNGSFALWASSLQSTSIRKTFHGTRQFVNNTPTSVIGSLGGQWITTGTAATALRFIASSGNITAGTIRIYGVARVGATPMPNMIHNPRFRTNQRAYASAASLASNEYGFDRWKATTASTSLTYSAAPQGQSVTISSGGSIAQIVERENVPAGDYVLSWTGTATGRVYNSGGSAPSYAASPVTVSLDGSANVVVEFEANGGTKTLDKVKLEPGTTPTGFVQPDVAAEMIQCMRFFQGVASWTGHGNGTTVIEMSYQYPVRMRAAPSMSKWPSATLNYRNNGGDTNVAAATWNIANNTQTAWGLWTQFTGNSSLTANRPYHSRMGANGGPVLALSADL